MAEVEILGPETLDVIYDGPVSAAAFSESAFSTLPSIVEATGIIQSGPNGLEIEFDDAIFLESDLVYDGSTPGITTPQTISLL